VVGADGEKLFTLSADGLREEEKALILDEAYQEEAEAVPPGKLSSSLADSWNVLRFVKNPTNQAVEISPSGTVPVSFDPGRIHPEGKEEWIETHRRRGVSSYQHGLHPRPPLVGDNCHYLLSQPQ